MANEEVWRYEDEYGEELNCTCDGDVMHVYTTRKRWDDVELPMDKARELRDFLTARLEGNDGRY